jgi:hypothetical protein
MMCIFMLHIVMSHVYDVYLCQTLQCHMCMMCILMSNVKMSHVHDMYIYVKHCNVTCV